MTTLNFSTMVDRWAIVGNTVVWMLGQDIVPDETPLHDLTEEVRAVVLSGGRKQRHFSLELFGVITPIDP